MKTAIVGLTNTQKTAYEDLYNEQLRLQNPEAYNKAISEKTKADKDYLKNSVERIKNSVDDIKSAYDIDVDNWEQISTAKQDILQNSNAELLFKQNKLINDFAEYYNTDLKNFKDTVSAKEDILNRFNETKVYSQIQQIIESDPESIAMTTIDKRTGEILRFASAKAQKQIDDLLAFSGLTFKDYANYRDFGEFTEKGNTALQNKLDEIVKAYTISTTDWNDMTQNIGKTGGSTTTKPKNDYIDWIERR